MSKLTYFLVPIGILLLAASLLRSESKPNESLKSISSHLNVISADPPTGLNFCGEAIPLHNFDVRERIDRELQRNVYFHSSTIMLIKRSARYQKRFLSILRSYGVPEDFFYLAVIESNLSNAVSPRGARGFWQFMKASAKTYNLEISESVDERYHPEKATHAAARYLRDLRKQFDTWTQTAAAFNMGPNGLKKALKKQETNSYYDLHLNAETGKYVFRILAIKSILENPARYGFLVDRHYRPISYRSVKVSDDIGDLALFAREQGTTYRMLKVMNPWLIKDYLVAAPNKTYEIRIPLSSRIYPTELMLEDIPEEEMDAPKTAQDSLE